MYKYQASSGASRIQH